MDRALWYLAVSAQPYFQKVKPSCFATSSTQRCFHQPTVVLMALLMLNHWGSLGALSVAWEWGLHLSCASHCIPQHLLWGNTGAHAQPMPQPHRTPTWHTPGGSQGAILSQV